jgi:pimeloyl-ACP methyl ester carboxylesterase
VDASTRRARSIFAAVLAAAVLVGACSRQEELRSRALEGSQLVTFTTADGVRLEGRLFGPAESGTGLVLAHMLPADQSAWYPLAGHLAAVGYRVLTFDFRGYCPGGDAGCSEGSKEVAAAGVDLAAAVAFLRSRGVGELGLIGASMGGTAAIRVASAEGSDVRALITLSAPQVIEGLTAGPAELQTVTAAKLFIAGNGDGTAADAAAAFYNASGQPKRYEIFPTDDHGTDLLTGGQGQRVIDLIDAWLGSTMPAPAGVSPSTSGGG